jgi:hypothetical protein
MTEVCWDMPAAIHPTNGPTTIEKNPLLSDWMLKAYFAYKRHEGPKPFPIPDGGNARMRKRLRVALRDDFKCKICFEDCPPDVGTVDHIIPTSKGGRDTYENMQWAHRFCNTKKGNTMPYAKPRMIDVAEPCEVANDNTPAPEPEVYRVPWEARKEIAIELIRDDFIKAAVRVLRMRDA